MLPLRYKWFWLGSGLLGSLAILGLALTPSPTPTLPFREGDKLLHFLAFAFLTVWFLGMVRDGRVLRLLVALVLYALLIELLQGFFPYRSADPRDVVADVAGMALGWVLASAGLRAWCGRLEALLAPVRHE